MKTILKKTIIAVIIIFIISIIFEAALVGYNLFITKIFEKKHLIGNQTYEVIKQNINFEDGDYCTLECEFPEIYTYNVELVLKNENEDVYIRLFYNNKEELMYKANKEQNAFRVFFKEGETLKNIKISFPKEQIEFDNIDRILINSNVEYLPSKEFSILNVLLIFTLISGIYVLILIYKFLSKKNIKIENTFLIVSLLIGTIFTFINLPLSKYDEHAHFWRSYELANGVLQSETKELPDSIFDVVIDKTTGEYHIENNTSYNYIIQKLNEPLNKENISKHSVGATANLSPFSYLPNIIGVFIGRLINMNPLYIVYLGRFTSLLVYVALIYMSIKIVPNNKWKKIIFLIGSLPMSLNLAASFSPDVSIISCSILFVSYILKLKYKDKAVSVKNYWPLLGLSLIVCMCKIVYIPLVLLVLLIPKEKFRKNRYIYIVGTILVIALIYIVWQTICVASPVITRVNPTEQVYFTLADIERDIFTGINTLYKFSGEYYFTMIGGWNTSNLISTILTILLFIIVFGENEIENEVENNEKYKLTKYDKRIILIVVLISCLLIFVGLYTQWTRAEFVYVEGVQGRYFLPVLLPTLLILEKNKFKYKIRNVNGKIIFITFLCYIPVFINTIISFSKIGV